MNKQEIFDKVLNHMRNQKLPARNNGSCVYYDETTNRKCAIGCLIPTEQYDPMFDTAIFCHVGVNVTVQKALENVGIKINEDMLEFLDQLQLIHDGIESPWSIIQESEMKEVAEKHSLNYVAA